ncbi:MAG: O-antigen ligase family protein [Ignavibacteria bacterium]|nr:MAG: O-antigen ligase family protein [Ignavibacteria bacterium]
MSRSGNSTLVFETGTLSGSGLGEASMTLTLASQRGLVLGFAVMGSIVLSAIIILTYGNLAAAYSFLGAFAVALISFYRLDVGLDMLVGLVLFFDEFDIPGFYAWTLSAGYFANLKESSYLMGSEWAVMNPFELHLFLLFFIWLLVVCLRRNVRFTPVTLWPSLAVMLLWMVVSLALGLQRGGDFLPALWEIRAMFYFALVFAFVPQVIESKAQIRTLLWVMIAAISIKAFQAIARYILGGFTTQGYPTLTNHEDPVFMTTLVILLLAFLLFRSGGSQKAALLALLGPLLLGFFLRQSRAAYASGAASLAVFFVLLSKEERRRLLKNSAPAILLFSLYCAVMWNSESRWAMPVKLVKSGFSNDRETAGERFYSNLYREHEKYDLAITVRNAPTIGIGFGKQYDQPIKLVPIPFTLRDYIPHNQILWLIVKMGGVGFFLFWLFFDGIVYRGASMVSRLQYPYLKAVCVMAVAAVVNQMVTSYYDLQLTYYRNMIYLAALLGLLPAIRNLDPGLSGNPDAERADEGEEI